MPTSQNDLLWQGLSSRFLLFFQTRPTKMRERERERGQLIEKLVLVLLDELESHNLRLTACRHATNMKERSTKNVIQFSSVNCLLIDGE